MIPYWVLFLVYAVGAVQYGPRRDRLYNPILFYLACFVTALMIGLRFEVGGDWSSYLEIFERIYFLTLREAVKVTDPGYALFNWIGAQFGADVWVTNLICGTIFMTGAARLASRQPNPWLAMTVAVPYLIIVAAMGYTRQATAIGVIMFILADIDRRSIVSILVLALFAALIHKTAALVLPILAVPLMRRNLLYAFVGGIMFVVLYYYLLFLSVDSFVYIYVERNYDSSGALVRLTMNALAGALMLFFRSRLGFQPLERSFWLTCAILSFAALGAFAVLPSTAGIDRLSLFLLPLQVVVIARLPYVYSTTMRPNSQVLAAVIAYSATVQAVWLNFGVHSKYWVPYKLVLGQTTGGP